MTQTSPTGVSDRRDARAAAAAPDALPIQKETR